MTVRIRPEHPGDIAAIEALTREAFLTEAHSSHTEQYIVNALRDAGVLSLSWVAERDGAVIGHASLSPVTLSQGEPGWYGLAPVSVLPAYQGQGVGSALVRQLLAQLQAQGAAGCVVLGDPGYYGRFGFLAHAGLTLPGVPAEYFQALSFGAAVPRGEVSFHPAFAAQAPD
ncbi:GNAT family N-acetyltransferase [Pseudomonas sp. MRSN 12121]|uniref:GNAT family N-acetyltransferase n=1 Tax=Pseudomonas sp. MRSN 12121 TaxID=1611770 RepID=UPI0005BEA6B2|nr:N-acetyltransferase [Pseudomonas sp. MRSN 12121]AJO78227.1 GCN5 family acetyltransferase [Pseudomonas sp. MRSN 12121]